ncbi:MAG: NusG domain II-containing protein [Clostridia bacterium]|nr:NusG domain II-containing protein [Clostridia bacterium]
MKKTEFILIFIIITISALLILFRKTESGDTVTITLNGSVFAEASLFENREIEVYETNTVAIENGEVYMKSASCPDKLCVHQGIISSSSEKIVCLPNKVIVEVSKKSDIDTVVK